MSHTLDNQLEYSKCFFSSKLIFKMMTAMSEQLEITYLNRTKKEDRIARLIRGHG
jgi:hypothetical protein